jgi:hypothetical protein
MTEWGNPWGRESPTSIGEHIVYGSETQGTEPSKYLEEKKTTVIPSVAASEGGRA